MKFIEKGDEPEAFAEWKRLGNEEWQPTYGGLRDHPPDHPQLCPRSELHISLMHEQGYICCYCGQRIDSLTSNIEHFKPRRRFPLLELEYQNLLASCVGGEGQVHPKQLHCNPAKGDWFCASLMVSPLQRNCGEYFVFTRDGQILPSQDPAKKDVATETIKRLNLNSDRLVRLRSYVLDGVFDELTLDADELKVLMAKNAARNSKGLFHHFCTAIISVAAQILREIRVLPEAE